MADAQAARIAELEEQAMSADRESTSVSKLEAMMVAQTRRLAMLETIWHASPAQVSRELPPEPQESQANGDRFGAAWSPLRTAVSIDHWGGGATTLAPMATTGPTAASCSEARLIVGSSDEDPSNWPTPRTIWPVAQASWAPPRAATWMTVAPLPQGSMDGDTVRRAASSLCVRAQVLGAQHDLGCSRSTNSIVAAPVPSAFQIARPAVSAPGSRGAAPVTRVLPPVQTQPQPLTPRGLRPAVVAGAGRTTAAGWSVQLPQSHRAAEFAGGPQSPSRAAGSAAALGRLAGGASAAPQVLAEARSRASGSCIRVASEHARSQSPLSLRCPPAYWEARPRSRCLRHQAAPRAGSPMARAASVWPLPPAPSSGTALAGAPAAAPAGPTAATATTTAPAGARAVHAAAMPPTASPGAAPAVRLVNPPAAAQGTAALQPQMGPALGVATRRSTLEPRRRAVSEDRRSF